MKVVSCANAHFYDMDMYKSCPYCLGFSNDSSTVSKKEILSSRELENKLFSNFIKNKVSDTYNEKTQGIYFSLGEINPVVGWLVCEEGYKKGLSYVLNAGNNYIFQDDKSGICICEEKSHIPRKLYCTVVFEPEKIQFFVLDSNGENILLNGQKINGVSQITEEDVIEIGESKFRLIPYCKKGRVWK